MVLWVLEGLIEGLQGVMWLLGGGLEVWNNLTIGLAPEIKPMTSPSCSQELY